MSALSLAPRFSGVISTLAIESRFNGLGPSVETVETVSRALSPAHTRLKPGANERHRTAFVKGPM